MAQFPFNDLHSFKDYVGFVRLCAPDLFPAREGVGPDEQWSLDLAFDGLRQGMDLAEKEQGQRPNLRLCRSLIDQALDHYRAGDLREGAQALAEVKQLLSHIETA
jgi:hypothetical protein